MFFAYCSNTAYCRTSRICVLIRFNRTCRITFPRLSLPVDTCAFCYYYWAAKTIKYIIGSQTLCIFLMQSVFVLNLFKNRDYTVLIIKIMKSDWS